jgi:hypothetical protein
MFRKREATESNPGAENEVDRIKIFNSFSPFGNNI